MAESAGSALSADAVGRLGEPGPVRELIRRIGAAPITFAEFMDVALYWPDGGYYTTQSGVWGPAGDYITSVDVSRSFSRAMARQVHEMWLALGSPEEFVMVEAGAGRGLLSKGIVKTVDELFPAFRPHLKIRLIEKNRRFHEGPLAGVSWHSSLDEVPSGLCGCIISNELIDSLPVHRIVFDSGLKEIFTGFDGEAFNDVIAPISTGAIKDYLRSAGVALIPGQRAEVNLAALDWMRSAAQLLGRGFVITIDYGFPSRELYSPERPGTLICSRRHRVNDNPYINVGRQDITAHADFTMLAGSGINAGLQTAGFTDQKNFLIGAGMLLDLKEPVEEPLAGLEAINHNRMIGALMAPGGMGDTFKVLIQRKGVEDCALMGFAFKDMSALLV